MAAGIVYDVAVIGAGVIGSAAASQIVKAGATVILLDQVAEMMLVVLHEFKALVHKGY